MSLIVCSNLSILLVIDDKSGELILVILCFAPINLICVFNSLILSVIDFTSRELSSFIFSVNIAINPCKTGSPSVTVVSPSGLDIVGIKSSILLNIILTASKLLLRVLFTSLNPSSSF